MSDRSTDRAGEEISKMQCPVCGRVFVITGYKAIGIPDGAKRPCSWDCRDKYDGRLYADGGAETDDTERYEEYTERFPLHPETLIEASEALRETEDSYNEYLADEMDIAFDRSGVDRSEYERYSDTDTERGEA